MTKNKSSLNEYIVTYSYGSNLWKNFSVVRAKDASSAREIIFEKTKGMYAFLYDSREEAGVDRRKLTRVPLQPQVMEW